MTKGGKLKKKVEGMDNRDRQKKKRKGEGGGGRQTKGMTHCRMFPEDIRREQRPAAEGTM